MWIDLTLLVFVALGFSVGFSRGIIRTTFNVLSLAFGVIAALRFTPAMTEFLKNAFNEDSALMYLAAIVITFSLTMLLIRLLARGLEGLLQTANVNIVNQVAGGALMAAVTTLLFSVVLNFILGSTYTDSDIQEATAESRTYPFLKDYPALALDMAGELRPVFTQFWDYSIGILDQVQDMADQTETQDFYDIGNDNNRNSNY
ncbi:MAG: CvpA family protein [Saprospiraceae bacterium]|nr:CvpA family protein [Saprospiraceae bacterium]